MRVDFYHLAGGSVDRVLPRIAERILADGGRLLVVAEDEGAAERIDAALWTYAADSFLPHGRADQPDADRQPVLIAVGIDPANGAANVALTDGVWRDEALGFERAFHFFDNEALDAARSAWRLLKDRDGVERRFWKQDQDGRWTQAA